MGKNLSNTQTQMRKGKSQQKYNLKKIIVLIERTLTFFHHVSGSKNNKSKSNTIKKK